MKDLIKLLKSKNATETKHGLYLSGDYENDAWATAIGVKGDRVLVNSNSEQVSVEVKPEWAVEAIKNWPASAEAIEAVCCDFNMGIENPAVKG
jgi:hypothetical protein